MSGGFRRNRPSNDREGARQELLAMRDEDLRVRSELAASGTLFDTYHPRMEQVHLRNAALLRSILEDHGWPDADRFGEEGESAAWMLLMHSISEPSLMRRGRTLLADAVRRNVAAPDTLARLDDRIRTLEGRPQVYGTILDWDDEGNLSPLPIADPDGVDARRAQVGLSALAEHVARCRREARAEGSRPPTDRSSKEVEYRRWLRRTGWR